MSFEIETNLIASCDVCGITLSEDSLVTCKECFMVLEDENKELRSQIPVSDCCRRCGRKGFMPESGYCSRSCELGYIPGFLTNPTERFLR